MFANDGNNVFKNALSKRMSQNHFLVASICALGGTLMFSIPYILRASNPPLDSREKMSGSQRQRGLYMNNGSHDAGPDPDWDPITRTWNGYEKNKKQSPPSSK